MKTFRCPHCQSLSQTDQPPGAQAVCPACRQQYSVPDLELKPVRPGPPELKLPQPKPEKTEPLNWPQFLKERWRLVVVPLCAIVGMAGYGSPSPLAQMTGNVATLIALCGFFTIVARDKVPERFQSLARWITIVVAVAVVVWCHKTATYREFENDVKLKSGQSVRVMTTYRRPRIPVERTLFGRGETKPGELLSASGPLTATGKRHGLWSIWIRGRSLLDSDQWYFHGEACTEAEFHRWSAGGRQ